ncbi:lytic transglycosylase domain-containing protein [Paraburkholderia diazotrophica]|uniref:lytic transglycosylase domain-containing protein n=1 Tax=Paraburkholderia diazotrophica TaxID=667676 RepID=UPI00317575CF
MTSLSRSLWIRRALLCGALAAPLAAHADCVLDAAKYHRVNPTVLLAIAVVESKMRPDAMHVNANGSHDMGVMQINSIHLPELARYGVKREDLYDGCKNVYTGAWILRKRLDEYGNTWAAIGAYHSATPALRDGYAARVHATVRWLVDSGYAYPDHPVK